MELRVAVLGWLTLLAAMVLPPACGARSVLAVGASGAVATSGAGGGSGGRGGEGGATPTSASAGGAPVVAASSSGVGGVGGVGGSGVLCCADQQNPFPPSTSPCTQGVQWLAWQYIPACSLHVARIELHTDQGSVGLLADANGMPGAFLFQGPLGPPDADGWRGADLPSPIPVTGGETYWIGESSNVCSVASQGDPQPYYGSDPNGWDGPYMSADHVWTSRIVGACPPPCPPGGPVPVPPVDGSR